MKRNRAKCEKIGYGTKKREHEKSSTKAKEKDKQMVKIGTKCKKNFYY